MAIFKIYERHEDNFEFASDDQRSIEMYIRYFTRTRKEDIYPVLVGYWGFHLKGFCCVEGLISEFILTQVKHCHSSGIRVRHECVMFKNADETMHSLYRQWNRVADIAYYFAQWYYIQGYQVIYAIHYIDGLYQIHYIINPVSFVDGSIYNPDISLIERQLSCINDTIEYMTGRRGTSVKITNYVKGYWVCLADNDFLEPYIVQQPVQFAYDRNREPNLACVIAPMLHVRAIY